MIPDVIKTTGNIFSTDLEPSQADSSKRVIVRSLKISWEMKIET